QVPLEHQLTVDLIGHDDQPARELGNPLELGAREHRAAGILRVAKKKQPRIAPNGPLDLVFIENPASMLQNQLQLGVRARRELHGALEVLVDRGRDERVAVGRQELARRKMQAGHHARQKDDPGRLDAPAVEPLQALDDGSAQLFRSAGVAEDAVLNPRLKSFKDARWSAKVAVGDPQGNHVAPGIALPAGAPGAGALERRVEIEAHPAVIAKKSRARGPASFCCVTLFLLLLLLLLLLLFVLLLLDALQRV